MRSRFLFLLLFPMLAGCSSDSAILGINDEDGDDILEEDPADPYEGAVLEILSPKANSFVLWKNTRILSSSLSQMENPWCSMTSEFSVDPAGWHPDPPLKTTVWTWAYLFV